jgi:hypothetical protein
LSFSWPFSILKKFSIFLDLFSLYFNKTSNILWYFKIYLIYFGKFSLRIWLFLPFENFVFFKLLMAEFDLFYLLGPGNPGGLVWDKRFHFKAFTPTTETLDCDLAIQTHKFTGNKFFENNKIKDYLCDSCQSIKYDRYIDPCSLFIIFYIILKIPSINCVLIYPIEIEHFLNTINKSKRAYWVKHLKTSLNCCISLQLSSINVFIYVMS